MAAVGGARPRYAPADPTLPQPWKALIDGNTGFIYFWNPVTKVTQYQRPGHVDPHNVAPVEGNGQGNELQARERQAAVAERADHSVNAGLAVEGGREPYTSAPQAASQYVSPYVQPTGPAVLRAPTYFSPREEPTQTAALISEAGPALSPEAYRSKHEIRIIGDEAPAPFVTFQSTGFPSELLRELQQAGFTAPTPIQAQSWPIALRSRDVVAVAKTGSGKTLGYLLPGFIHLKRLRNNSRMGPTVLVLSPTRELATQIQDEAVKFGQSGRITCACLYGGAPKGPQLRDLDRGADVVVATPGRLNDILEMRRVSLQQVSYLVLDEADRMLDMGFEPQIRKIVNQLPTRRQTLMYTATWPKEVRKIAGDLLTNPVQINIGNTDELNANKSITQHILVISPMEKRRRLEEILRSLERGSRAIIFCSTKRMCDQLARNLEGRYSAAAIHGDKSQAERDSVLSHFRSGRTPILVATDVAARGLDIKDIRVVINYDFPTGVEDYVHRIGRTGRAGATGDAYTFFCDQDAKYAADLVKILEGANQSVPSQLRDMAHAGGYGSKSRRWGSPSRDRNFSHNGSGSNAGYGGMHNKSSAFDRPAEPSSNCGSDGMSFHTRFYSGQGNSSTQQRPADRQNGGLSNSSGVGQSRDNCRRRSRSPGRHDIEPVQSSWQPS